jgi:transcription elongation factor GreB
MKSAAGDSVVLQLPGGTEYPTVLEVCYERISVEPWKKRRNGPGGEGATTVIERYQLLASDRR